MEVVEGYTSVASVDEFVARLGDVGAEHGCAVQAFDARYVVGEAHLRRAVELADRAFARGETVARDRAVEILLYAAGRRQIDQALELGVAAGDQSVVVVVSADGAGPDEPDGASGAAGADEADEAGAAAAVADLLTPGETLGAYDEDRVRSYYDVTDEELGATEASLEELVCERVALLTVER
ncbi:KEOPS complex subunit Cgi121 [Halomarina litorea]|uniref:KEOPS complex subunit Cgi121 n=1 Tax=Halomarina litorea TaxID=2961595 RepID=UPI0020C37965|nr:KEOPS complex subunit Cgi121 [Halomarina sp. BCD28]